MVSVSLPVPPVSASADVIESMSQKNQHQVCGARLYRTQGSEVGVSAWVVSWYQSVSDGSNRPPARGTNSESHIEVAVAYRLNPRHW